jgi:hypothetical protein
MKYSPKYNYFLTSSAKREIIYKKYNRFNYALIITLLLLCNYNILNISRDDILKPLNTPTMKTYNILLSDSIPALPTVHDTDHIIFNPFQFNPNLLDKVYALNYYDVPETIPFDPGWRESKSLYSLFKLWKTYDQAMICREQELILRKRLQMELYCESPQMELFPGMNISRMKILA